MMDDEDDNVININPPNNGVVNNINDYAVQRVDAEILQYRSERKLNRTIPGPNGGQVLSNPLQWWSEKAIRYSIRSHLAKMILCIPATSAPTERLFSVIANNRTRLLPENAEDLVFLHDAWPECENL